jgi:hypothetical protein
MARYSFRCNLVDRCSIGFPNYRRLMVRFRIAIDCLIRFRTGSPTRFDFRLSLESLAEAEPLPLE